MVSAEDFELPIRLPIYTLYSQALRNPHRHSSPPSTSYFDNWQQGVATRWVLPKPCVANKRQYRHVTRDATAGRFGAPPSADQLCAIPAISTGLRDCGYTPYRIRTRGRDAPYGPTAGIPRCAPCSLLGGSLAHRAALWTSPPGERGLKRYARALGGVASRAWRRSSAGSKLGSPTSSQCRPTSMKGYQRRSTPRRSWIPPAVTRFPATRTRRPVAAAAARASSTSSGGAGRTGPRTSTPASPPASHARAKRTRWRGACGRTS